MVVKVTLVSETSVQTLICVQHVAFITLGFSLEGEWGADNHVAGMETERFYLNNVPHSDSLSFLICFALLHVGVSCLLAFSCALRFVDISTTYWFVVPCTDSLNNQLWSPDNGSQA